MKFAIFQVVLALTVLLFVGCGPSIRPLTSEMVPQNASGIYTLSMRAESTDGSIEKDSYDAFIVIDGQRHRMTRSDLGNYIWEYEYVMPPGKAMSKYYYELEYLQGYDSFPEQHTVTSDLRKLQLTNRYAIQLVSQRGPVGARIPVVGDGFFPDDKIIVGGEAAETDVASPNSLSFIIPALPAGDSYQVQLMGKQGPIGVGRLFVDGAKLEVRPEQLTLSPGQKDVLGVRLPTAAPAGGMPLEVTTNIPDSIIMAEVVVPGGQRQVTMPVQGGSPGSGSLWVAAPGFSEVRIPVTVSGKGGQGGPNRTATFSPAAAQTSSTPANRSNLSQSQSSGNPTRSRFLDTGNSGASPQTQPVSNPTNQPRTSTPTQREEDRIPGVSGASSRERSDYGDTEVIEVFD